MIADKNAQKKGLASEAVKIILEFGWIYYGKTQFIAKIKMDNLASINFFEKLGFKKVFN